MIFVTKITTKIKKKIIKCNLLKKKTSNKQKDTKMRQLKIIKQITKRDDQSLDKYLLEISKVELLDAVQETELANRIKKGDVKAFNTLVQANLRFVVSVAKQYQNKGLSLPDLISEGNIGLIKAARRFDETKGFKFISYAVWWIRQSILQSLAENSRIVRLPLNKVGSVNKINQAFIKLLQKYEREPTAEEIAKELDIAPKEVKDAIRLSEKHVSVDAPLGNSEDSELKLLDLLSSKDSPDFSDESLKEEIEKILNTLSPREAEIIRLYYGINYPSKSTLDEIGKKLDLTRERVRQIKGRTMRILKQRRESLKTYLN